ncbi:transmembrane protein 192 [Brachionichthys hirsutus]|uniref:transmembrane protein 192 n=1 Tax=Brachionichthys hirsutus TaxID=412623 RepID=UPI003605414B
MESREPHLYTPAGTVADLSHSQEEDPLVDEPLIPDCALQSAIRREFQAVPTPCHAGLLSLLHVTYVVLSMCLAVLCVLKAGQEELCSSILGDVNGESAILFGKVCLWVLVALFTGFAQRHHSRTRIKGYLRFYRRMQALKHLPLAVHSTGNVLLLVVLAARLSPTVRTYMLLGIIGLELLAGLPCLICYTVKVMQFNRDQPAPDVSQEEHSHDIDITHVPTETGFREGSSLEEVMEKQADLIEYLKQHNSLLSKRLLNLTAQH